MPIHFYKYHGTGNDFILLDNRTNVFHLSAAQIRQMCRRCYGIGADGLMLLNTAPGYDFEMKYYNADGNESSMCGNGGRCIVRFAHSLGIHKLRHSFIAADGPHEATLQDNGWVHLKMKSVDAIEEVDGYDIIDTGSPHLVKSVSNIMHFNVAEHGRHIRYSKPFEEKGINVNFTENFDKYIYVRTYERGVEDETQSCGTGVTAVALLNYHNELGFNRIEIQTPGGNLAVEYNKTGDASYEDIWLCGPAEFVFQGNIEV